MKPHSMVNSAFTEKGPALLMNPGQHKRTG